MTDKKVWRALWAPAVAWAWTLPGPRSSRLTPVVATALNADTVTAALGQHDGLLAVKVGRHRPRCCRRRLSRLPRDRSGRIDVLVNNAGNFHARVLRGDPARGSPGAGRDDPVRPDNLTVPVLPVMRGQRCGLVVAISSTAGIVGQEFCTAYAASKFGVEPDLELRPPPKWRRSYLTWSSSLVFSAPSCPRRESTKVRRTLHLRLRRVQRASCRFLDFHERPAGGAPRQALQRPGPSRW